MSGLSHSHPQPDDPQVPDGWTTGDVYQIDSTRRSEGGTLGVGAVSMNTIWAPPA